MTRFDDLSDGFYLLTNGNEENCLVKLYTVDMGKYAVRGIGFGIWDGCDFMALEDLTEKSILLPLESVNALFA